MIYNKIVLIKKTSQYILKKRVPIPMDQQASKITGFLVKKSISVCLFFKREVCGYDNADLHCFPINIYTV